MWPNYAIRVQQISSEMIMNMRIGYNHRYLIKKVHKSYTMLHIFISLLNISIEFGINAKYFFKLKLILT
jgi:hypothetical protein